MNKVNVQSVWDRAWDRAWDHFWDHVRIRVITHVLDVLNGQS